MMDRLCIVGGLAPSLLIDRQADTKLSTVERFADALGYSSSTTSYPLRPPDGDRAAS